MCQAGLWCSLMHASVQRPPNNSVASQEHRSSIPAPSSPTGIRPTSKQRLVDLFSSPAKGIQREVSIFTKSDKGISQRHKQRTSNFQVNPCRARRFRERESLRGDPVTDAGKLFGVHLPCVRGLLAELLYIQAMQVAQGQMVENPPHPCVRQPE